MAYGARPPFSTLPVSNAFTQAYGAGATDSLSWGLGK